MKIRQVLARLAHEQIVTLVPNRGAYVARPTVEDAREMFETRRLIEPPLVGKLRRQASPENIALLRRMASPVRRWRVSHRRYRICC
nr:hypothetical protein [Allopusillimonas ginsengisoli]